MYQSIEPNIESWLKAGWGTYKECFYPLMAGAAVLSFLGILQTLFNSMGSGVWLTVVYVFVVGPILNVGWAWLCLRCVRRQEAGLRNLVEPAGLYFTIVGMFIIYAICVTIGMIFLIAPGIYIAVRYSLCWFVVIDKKLGTVKSLKQAGTIVQGLKGKLLGLILLLGLMGLISAPFSLSFSPLFAQYRETLLMIGIIPYLVSVFLVIPFAGASMAAAYESISQVWESKLTARVAVEGTDQPGGSA